MTLYDLLWKATDGTEYEIDCGEYEDTIKGIVDHTAPDETDKEVKVHSFKVYKNKLIIYTY
jgi:hypothetical protein